ncbi:PilN domain-containing protein [Pandoraea sp.]|uniref:PilN domain-containing protein n=1 Tax=Pandoraea sp. TaxID=1883445 RepID=UPI0012150A43|nr:PilN domain-containing protein [Pandoraea sp.]TAL53749.1 MAG: hypothetical protein EPN80_13825 [Pandoraea sp.]TAM17002.1 MAG: hypothetical protein EPN65_11995 [Pandoraea sp.]
MTSANLLPSRAQRRSMRRTRLKRVLLISAVSGLAISAVAWAALERRIVRQDLRNDFVREALAELQPPLRERLRMEKAIEQYEQRVNRLQRLTALRPPWGSIFADLAKSTPPTMHLQTIRYQAGQLSLSGRADTQAAILQYQRRLGDLLWGADTSLVETKAVVDATGASGFAFEIHILMRPPAPDRTGAETSLALSRDVLPPSGNSTNRLPWS